MKYIIPAFLPLILADVPTNCMLPDFLGTWQFNIGTQGSRDDVVDGASYKNLGAVSSMHNFEFSEYDQVRNVDTGAVGTFTFIYNQAVRFDIDGRIWWAYFSFDKSGYDCSQTSVGFAHDKTGTSFARIQGVQQNPTTGFVPHAEALEIGQDRLVMEDLEFISKINEKQPFWRAHHDKTHDGYTLKALQAKLGQRETVDPADVPRSTRNIDSVVGRAMRQHKRIVRETGLPENLDWTNKDGVNYVSPVDDQASCGSCYSFASMGLLEARVRVQTNNLQQPIFSEQEVITCGREATYNQGCAGGFAYLTAGEYAADFGVVEEDCAPYNPADRTCPDTTGCQRWYTTGGGYVGGFYGASETDGGQMMMEAMQDGPLAVGFNVLDDFRNYQDGVYVNTGLKSDFNPFVPINHAVLAVGYGVCDGSGEGECGDAPAGTPYWKVKNSWGTGWGNNGYFLILRGVDEVGIESVPYWTQPIPQL